MYRRVVVDNLLINVLFGHFIGDFFLQHKLMAENKFLPGGKNFLWCTFHVAVYTVTVAVFAGNFSLQFLLGVFVPHFVADRWSLAYHWMQLINRSDLMGNSDPSKTSFGTVIYVVIDQTYHLGCLYILLFVVHQ